MNKPVGGRGLKAIYDTTHSRIPIVLKPLIDSLSDCYREVAVKATGRNPIYTNICEILPEKFQREVILNALDRYIEEERQRDRKGNQYGKDIKLDSARWDKFNQFKKWIEEKLN